MFQKVRPEEDSIVFCTRWSGSLYVGPVAYRKQFWFHPFFKGKALGTRLAPWVFGMRCYRSDENFWEFYLFFCGQIRIRFTMLSPCRGGFRVFRDSQVFFIISSSIVFYCSLSWCAIFCSVISFNNHWRIWYFPGVEYSLEFILVGVYRTVLQILTAIQNCHFYTPVFRPGL